MYKNAKKCNRQKLQMYKNENFGSSLKMQMYKNEENCNRQMLQMNENENFW